MSSPYIQMHPPRTIDAAHEPDVLADLELVRAIPEEEDPNDTAGGFEGPLMTEEEAAASHLADEHQAQVDLQATLARIGEPATITVVEGGHAGREICELAATRAADVLVVGASDKGWFRRLLSGSVMEYAAHHAPCPVLIVRHGD